MLHDDDYTAMNWNTQSGALSTAELVTGYTE